jgi:hypothetical protein
MVYLVAFFIFFGISAVTWAIALALFQTYLGGPDLRQHPNFIDGSFVTCLLASLALFFPYWTSCFLALGVWGLAVFTFFGLRPLKASVLFLTLAALSFVARLVVGGVLAF